MLAHRTRELAHFGIFEAIDHAAVVDRSGIVHGDVVKQPPGRFGGLLGGRGLNRGGSEKAKKGEKRKEQSHIHPLPESGSLEEARYPTVERREIGSASCRERVCR